MKKVWNKETRRDDGGFYRSENWGTLVEDDFGKDNFTEIKPPEETIEHGIPCDFIDGSWIIDKESIEFKTLYQKLRVYPDPMEFNDAMVKKHSTDALIIKEGIEQEQKYYADCLEVKKQFPKPE